MTTDQPAPFLRNVLLALNETPKQLADSLGVKYHELEPLLDVHSPLADMDYGWLWWKIYEHVNTRLGLILAARHEINKGLQKDRARRVARIETVRQRDKKPSPR